MGLNRMHILELCSSINMPRVETLKDANRIFERLSKEDVAPWNVMISGLISCELFDEAALYLIAELPKFKVKLNNLTLVASKQACSNTFVLNEGMHIHSYLIRNGIILKAFIISSLIGIYARCGELEEAQNIFDHLYKKDVVSWNAMMAGYTQYGLGWEALCLFSMMCRSYHSIPDEGMFVIASSVLDDVNAALILTDAHTFTHCRSWT